jgi:phytoene/squalene synthetase
VGELVLHVFGAATPARIALSDRICAGLQVTEHLQDVTEDYLRGRIYLPRQDMEAFGAGESELGPGSRSSGLRALMAFGAERARRLLAEGALLAKTLSPRPRLAVAGFVAGGRAALDALEASGYTRKQPAGKRSFAAGWVRAVSGR